MLFVRQSGPYCVRYRIGTYDLPVGKRFRAPGWMAVTALALLIALKGSSYFFTAAYPMLIAAGAVAWQKGLARLSTRTLCLLRGITLGSLAIGVAGAAMIALPIAPGEIRLMALHKLHT